MEHEAGDDESVHSTAVPDMHVEQSVPKLCVSRNLGGRKAPFFESSLSGCFVKPLLTAGQANLLFLLLLHDNQLSFQPLIAPRAALYAYISQHYTQCYRLFTSPIVVWLDAARSACALCGCEIEHN
jgi:hypothetical protein